MARRTNHTDSPPMNATAATMVVPSPPPVGRCLTPAATPGDPTQLRAFFSNVATILIILACVSLLAFSLHAAARFLLRRLASRRAARARARAQGQPQPPKPPSDAATAEFSVEAGAGAGVQLAGGWGDAECAICLSELADGERVRVLRRAATLPRGLRTGGSRHARAAPPAARRPGCRGPESRSQTRTLSPPALGQSWIRGHSCLYRRQEATSSASRWGSLPELSSVVA
ncbi:hypothetical protein ZWY2020_055267 [Hordeum vulgare]|nr:hypothetical protein ZWY2020_055267 [Hordeum vulgare]